MHEDASLLLDTLLASGDNILLNKIFVSRLSSALQLGEILGCVSSLTTDTCSIGYWLTSY